MDSHFCKETLQQDLEALFDRTSADGLSDLAGRAICAEARFEINHTALDRAYEAHLWRHADD
ncbi:MAG: hypothetical protein WD845_18460 [Pirellulales bacterium]